MKPLTLQLQGFGCFRGATSVSFDALELFAISGPTGAGKSTLLDAMTYALYGQTARIGAQVKDTLFSPGLDQLSVTLEFRTDQSNTYRVTRVSERKGGRAPKNETRIEHLGENARWQQFSESEKLKEADEKLKKIVGLDYASFTRAVLLPQGDFDQFLRGSANERIRLLTSLLGLERVEAMQKLAGETARSAKERERGLRERLGQDFAGTTPERRRALKRELAELGERQRELEGQRAGLSEQLAALTELKGLFDEQRAVQRRLSGLREQGGGVEAAREALGRARAAEKLLPHLSDLEARRARAEQERAKERGLAARLARAEAAFEGAQAEFQEAAAGQARLPELSEKLEALAELRPLMAQLRGRGGDLSLAQEVGEEPVKGAVKGAGKEPAEPYSDEAWDALQRLASELPGLKRAQGDAEEAVKAVTRAERSLEETETALRELKTSLHRRLSDGKAAGELLETRRQQYEAALAEDQAAALRPHLHVGEACPVCEQVVQTLPPPRESRVGELKAALGGAERRVGEERERYSEERGRLGALQSGQGDRQEALTRAQGTLERQRARVSEAEAAFAHLGTTAVAELERYLKARRRSLLAGLAGRVAARTGGRDPEAAYAALSRERSTLEEAFRTAQSALHTAQLARDALRAETRALGERLRDLEEEGGRAERRFAELLSGSAFDGAQAVRDAALSEARQRDLETRAERHARDLEAAERQAVTLEAKLAGRSFDEGAFAAAQAQREAAESELAAAQRRAGECAGALAHLEEQLGRAKTLRAEAQRALEVASVYGVLDRDLQRKHFPTYLLERVQRELALRASSILKSVTENRYDLRFEGGEYSVLDAWSGELRSAKTLSGGESFITSLALALALSDTLAGSTSLGALFLDEGFGTLDAETLDAVAGVLESLTENGRMVGVITHVQELTARLPARLEVRKGPEGSEVSWDA